MESSKIKLSILLITYNHEKYIAHTIESILQQEIGEVYEVLIGDDCSTDATREIILRYQEQYKDIIKPVFQEKNVGAARNIYDLLMKAQGDYILRLEGDNYWEKTEQIKKGIEFLDKNKDVIGMSYQCKTIDEETGEILRTGIAGKFENNIATMNDFLKGKKVIGSLCYRNFYKLRDNDYTIIYKGGRMIAERTLDLLVFERGNVYVTDQVWEVSRGGKRCKGASNYQSINKREKILEEWLHNAEVLQEYRKDLNFFNKKAIPAGEILWDAFRAKDKKKMKELLQRFSKKEQIILLVKLLKRIIVRGMGKVGRSVRKN